MSEHAEHPAPVSAAAGERPVTAAVRPGSALRCGAAWATLVGVGVGAIAADLFSKWLAFQYVAQRPVPLDPGAIRRVVAENAQLVREFVPRHPPLTVVPHALDLTLVLNPGAVFGVAPGGRWFFVLFTAAALAFGLWIFGTWTRAKDRWAHVALGLVIGGGLGNVYDRLVYGCVRDFLHPLPGVKFPFGLRLLDRDGFVWPYVSNVADLLLLIGIGMLLIYLWRRDGSHGGRGTTARGAQGAPPPIAPH